MRITHTDIYRLSIPMEPFTIATTCMDHAQNLFIRIHTDTGIYGVGECSAFPMIVGETQDTCLALARDFAKLWKGKPALAIVSRLAELDAYCARNYTIKSAFDIALHDLKAKAEGLPLYQLLGGQKRKIQTDITVGIGSPEIMATTAVKYVQQGAQHLKVKLGKNVAEDVIRIAAIRGAVGRRTRIRIDANQGWDFESAVTALQGMEKYDIEFCEQPMPAWSDHLLPELRNTTSIKIMADESCYTSRDAKRLIDNQSCDYINIKLAKCGGIREALAIHDICCQAEISCMIGGMLESRLATTVSLHLAYAASGIRFFDIDSPLLGLLEDPVVGGIQYHTGYGVSLHDTPGIGADINDEFLSKCEQWTV